MKQYLRFRKGYRQDVSPSLVAAGISLCSIAVGLAQRWFVGNISTRFGFLNQYIYPFQRDAFVQLGVAGFVVSLGLFASRLIYPSVAPKLQERPGFLASRVLLVIVISFATGETALRVLFWDGMSFVDRAGPMVRRFERNFRLNRFDGSRGPEPSGPKRPGSTRLVVQGDSITWGQGVRDERNLYTSRLLGMLREHELPVDMAVLARPGREIDGHVEQFQKFGRELAPDVVIYQWFLNDLELSTKAYRPKQERVWRRVFFHRVLYEFSFLWFYLDYRIDEMLPGPARTYSDYLLQHLEEDTSYWREFEVTFREWAEHAKAVTPHVVVVLYRRVHAADDDRLNSIYAKVKDLCRDEGVETIDLAESFQDLTENRRAIWATAYDPHPSVMAHGRIALTLYRSLVGLWPDLFRASSGGREASRSSGANAVVPEDDQLLGPAGVESQRGQGGP